MNAEQIIAECELDGAECSQSKSGSTEDDTNARVRLGYTVGAMVGHIYRLCAELESLRSAAGIAAAIAKLPSEHEGLSAVLNAIQGRMDDESDVLGSHGFDVVAGCLEDACCALDDCTWADADELARIWRQVRAEQDSIERQENRENERDERFGKAE